MDAEHDAVDVSCTYTLFTFWAGKRPAPQWGQPSRVAAGREQDTLAVTPAMHDAAQQGRRPPESPRGCGHGRGPPRRGGRHQGGRRQAGGGGGCPSSRPHGAAAAA